VELWGGSILEGSATRGQPVVVHGSPGDDDAVTVPSPLPHPIFGEARAHWPQPRSVRPARTDRGATEGDPRLSQERNRPDIGCRRALTDVATSCEVPAEWGGTT
jgi:hypothetical protein